MVFTPAQPTKFDKGKHTRLCLICGKRFEVKYTRKFMGVAFTMFIMGDDPGPYCGCHVRDKERLEMNELVYVPIWERPEGNYPVGSDEWKDERCWKDANGNPAIPQKGDDITFLPQTWKPQNEQT